MGLVGLMTDSPVLLAAAFMQILYQSNPFARLAQSSLAVRFASFPAGAATGWVIAASAVGSFIGSVLGGFLADSLGFNSIAFMAAIAAGVAVALIVLVLGPANQRIVDAKEPTRAEITPEAPPSA
jgi:predicted MFS family arabinose efflux permease